MSRVLRANEVPIAEVELSVPEKVLGMLPVITPIVLAVAIILARLQFGRSGFLNEGALTMLALVSYITAAVLLLTNLFVKDALVNRLGLITVTRKAGRPASTEYGAISRWTTFTR